MRVHSKVFSENSMTPNFICLHSLNSQLLEFSTDEISIGCKYFSLQLLSWSFHNSWIRYFGNLHEFCIHEPTLFTKLHRAAEARVVFPVTALLILDMLCFLCPAVFSSCDGDAEVRASDFAARAASVKLGWACVSGADAGPVDCYTFSGTWSRQLPAVGSGALLTGQRARSFLCLLFEEIRNYDLKRTIYASSPAWLCRVLSATVL